MDFWSGQMPFELTIVSSNALFAIAEASLDPPWKFGKKSAFFFVMILFKLAIKKLKFQST